MHCLANQHGIFSVYLSRGGGDSHRLAMQMFVFSSEINSVDCLAGYEAIAATNDPARSIHRIDKHRKTRNILSIFVGVQFI